MSLLEAVGLLRRNPGYVVSAECCVVTHAGTATPAKRYGHHQSS
jgi:hypothetical protein